MLGYTKIYPQHLTVSPADVVTYIDSNGLAQTTTYYYQVRAYNTGGNSGYSTAISATTLAGGGQEWSFVVSGGKHNIGLKPDGSIWGWGGNNSGQLGLNDNSVRNTPTQIGSSLDWASAASGKYLVDMAHTIALKNNGTIWTCGQNSFGQLGRDGSGLILTSVGTASDWNKVFAGASQTYARKTNGTLWAWGYNFDGELGCGDQDDRLTPTQINTQTDWSDAFSSYWHCLALKNDKTLWSWGNNYNGQLGLGDFDDRWIPTKVNSSLDWSKVFAGYYYNLALKTNGSLWSWGLNDSGELGHGDTNSRNTPTQMGTGLDWDSIAAGGYEWFSTVKQHSVGKKSNGAIWSWGDNEYGQLGLGNSGTGTNRLSPAQIGIQTDWSQISAGIAHTIGVKTDRKIWVWGYNDFSQLGLGDAIDRNTPTQIGN